MAKTAPRNETRREPAPPIVGIEHLPLGAAIIGPDGVVLAGNPALVRTLGPVDAGTAFASLAHDEDTGTVALQVARLLRGEASDYRGEHRLRHADGSAVWTVISAVRLGDGTVLVQVTDIDRLKSAEAALRYTEDRWNSALECSGQGVWDHDIRTDTMFYSRMWKVMRGIDPSEEIDGEQEKWLERLHPDDVAPVRAVVDKQDSGEEGFDGFEYRERRRDGSYVWILSRGRPIAWDENGKAVRTIGTDTDITRLKTIELELAAEKERLRITLASIGDGVISTDGDGIITFINPAAARLTNWVAEKAIGQPVERVFPIRSDVTGAAVANPVFACLETGDTIDLDDVVLAAPESPARDIRCSAAPLGDHDRSMGAVLVFQDITQSRTLQRQLAHAANHDSLTELPNRAAFDAALSSAIASARGGRRHGLVCIDLDRFKPVNDTAGHAAGDELLRQVARTIRACCRSHDVAARIGGDEFAVLLEDCPPENARVVAGKIVRAVGALEFAWAGRTYRIGASAGITMIGATPASRLGFLGEADAACYAAKGAGRNCAISYNDIA